MSHPLLKLGNNFDIHILSSLPTPDTYKREMETHSSLTESCFQTSTLQTPILSTHLLRPLC